MSKIVIASLLLLTSLSAKEEQQQPLYNLSARPFVKDPPDLFVAAEVLLMRPEQGGMEFAFRADGAYLGKPTVPLPFTQPLSGAMRTNTGKWDWGLRIAAGYNMRYDGWDVGVTWMRFHSVTSRTKYAGAGKPLIPLVVPPLSGQNNSTSLLQVNSASLRWTMKIDMIDFELGREFFVSKKLTLRPFLGPRGLMIPQAFNPLYHGGTLVSEFATTSSPLTSDPGSTMSVHARNHFYGIGPRLGLNSVWRIGGGVSVFGTTDLSMLWGRFHLRSRFDVVSRGVETTVANVRNYHHARRPTATLGIGARYDYIYEDSYAFGAELGYEHMTFWHQNQFMKFDIANSLAMNAANDDLSLAGLHLGFSFDF